MNILPEAGVQTEIEQKIRQFITDNFLFREDRASLTDSESLLEAGVIDSTGVLELIAVLETEFGFTVGDAEMVPENLDSISRIAGYVKGKTA